MATKPKKNNDRNASLCDDGLHLTSEIDTTPADAWPDPPDPWPDVLDEIQAAQYLHLDEPGRPIEAVKRTMRYLRQKSGLPSPGRVVRKILYRREAIDAWLADREKGRDSVASSNGNEDGMKLGRRKELPGNGGNGVSREESGICESVTPITFTGENIPLPIDWRIPL